MLHCLTTVHILQNIETIYAKLWQKCRPIPLLSLKNQSLLAVELLECLHPHAGVHETFVLWLVLHGHYTSLMNASGIGGINCLQCSSNNLEVAHLFLHKLDNNCYICFETQVKHVGFQLLNSVTYLVCLHVIMPLCQYTERTHQMCAAPWGNQSASNCWTTGMIQMCHSRHFGLL